MFKKKKCKNCDEKLGKNYKFCPYCRFPIEGSNLHENEENFGLLGKDDCDFPGAVKLPMGFNTLFNFLMKNLSQQLSELDKMESESNGKMKKKGIGISIHTSGNKPPEINITSFGTLPKNTETKKPKKDLNEISKTSRNKLNKFANLPKEEPKTNIRRLSNKVVYELNAEGVSSLEDVYITPLENSIEVKALAKDKLFSKIIPFNLPIKKYGLSKGKIILELETQD